MMNPSPDSLQASAALVAPNANLRTTGTALEYSLLWYRTVLLTILTLGIYSPWGKIARLQYLYQHTFIGNRSFNYTADPIKILKGRCFVGSIIIGMVGLCALGFLFPLFFLLIPVFILTALLAIPWIITTGLSYRAKSSRFNDIPFAWKGTYKHSFKYFIIGNGMQSAAWGLLFPFVKQRQRKYLVNNLTVGKQTFQFNGSVRDYFGYYWGVAFLPLSVVAGVLLGISVVFSMHRPQITPSLIYIIGTITLVPILLLGWIPFQKMSDAVKLQNQWRRVTLNDIQITNVISLKNLVFLKIINSYLNIITLGLAIPFGTFKEYQYLISAMRITGNVEKLVATAEDAVASINRESTLAENAAEAIAETVDFDIDIGF